VVSSSLAAFFLLVPLSLPLPAFAENVRVQDVESNTLRAGLEAANEGRLDAAERFFKAYIAQEDPQSASAYSNLGNVHLQQGRYDVHRHSFLPSVSTAAEIIHPTRHPKLSSPHLDYASYSLAGYHKQ
jgi:tetratricopeptide (TPR) repeat protein